MSQVKLRKLVLGSNHIDTVDEVLVGVEHFDHEFYAVFLEKKNAPRDSFDLILVPVCQYLDLNPDEVSLACFGKIGEAFHAVLYSGQ